LEQKRENAQNVPILVSLAGSNWNKNEKTLRMFQFLVSLAGSNWNKNEKAFKMFQFPFEQLISL